MTFPRQPRPWEEIGTFATPTVTESGLLIDHPRVLIIYDGEVVPRPDFELADIVFGANRQGLVQTILKNRFGRCGEIYGLPQNRLYVNNRYSFNTLESRNFVAQLAETEDDEDPIPIGDDEEEPIDSQTNGYL